MMYVDALPSDPQFSRRGRPAGEPPKVSPLGAIRVRGGISLRFDAPGGQTRLYTRSERDGYKVRLPRRPDVVEAALINTGGGVAGGDEVEIEVSCGSNVHAVVATPAAERIYAAADQVAASIETRLALSAGARLCWLPQETILFDRARLNRLISVEMHRTARLLLAETLVFGRTASGEQITDGHFRDDWRIHRDGRLVFADSVRLDGAISARLQGRAFTAGQPVVATMLLVSTDASDHLDLARHVIDVRNSDLDGLTAGASAWNGLLVVRAIAARGDMVRRLFGDLVPVLSGQAPPRVWGF